MNIKIGADELIYHLRKNDKCKDIDDITLGNKIAKFFKGTFGEESFIQKDVPSYWCDNNHTINDYFKHKKLPLTSQLYEINIENIFKRYIVVCREDYPRLVDGIEILPWKYFFKTLWN